MRLKSTKILAGAQAWGDLQKQLAGKLAPGRNAPGPTAMQRPEPNAAHPTMKADRPRG